MHTPYRGVEYTCTSRTSGKTSLEVLGLPWKSYYSTLVVVRSHGTVMYTDALQR
jgi:hypothetical protein